MEMNEISEVSEIKSEVVNPLDEDNLKNIDDNENVLLDKITTLHIVKKYKSKFSSLDFITS